MAFPVVNRATDDLISAAIWNADIVANLNAVARPIPKTADESVTSNTTLQNDDHLFFAMAANEFYAVRGTLWASSSSVGHLKLTFTVPAGATYMMIAEGVDTGGSTYAHANIRSVSDTPDFFLTSTGILVNLRGVVVCAGTAGNFQLQWAQNTSNATASVMKKGSHLLISKLG